MLEIRSIFGWKNPRAVSSAVWCRRLQKLLSKLSAVVDASPELRFIWVTLKRLLLFIVIATSAVGVHSIATAFEQHGAPQGLVGASTFIEYLILIADVVWFSKPLVLEIIATITEIFHGRLLLVVAACMVLFILGALSGARLSGFINALAGTLPGPSPATDRVK
jgi:hypothetical protein